VETDVDRIDPASFDRTDAVRKLDEISVVPEDDTDDITLSNLWNSTLEKGLSVGLTKRQDNLMEEEARWLPQLEEAKELLDLRNQLLDENNSGDKDLM